jgi:hypothetical protein
MCTVDGIRLATVQAVAWTAVVFAAFFTADVVNVRVDAARALDIAVPQELWLLLGISTLSLVGSPLVEAKEGARPTRGV